MMLLGSVAQTFRWIQVSLKEKVVFPKINKCGGISGGFVIFKYSRGMPIFFSYSKTKASALSIRISSPGNRVVIVNIDVIDRTTLLHYIFNTVQFAKQ